MKVDKCIKVGENIHCAICTLCISDADFHKWVAHSTATLHVFLCKGMCSTVANSRIEAWVYQHQFSGISTNAVHQYQLSSENIFTVPWFLFNLYFWTISKHISPNTFAKLALLKLNINLKRQWMCSEKTLTFTQKPSFQFTQWQILVQSNRDNQPTNESKLYILCESPKCSFSNLKLYKLCKYLIGKHALMAIDCCTGSKQQNS